MIGFSGQGILLDIEGTTSSIAFVTQTLFPYVRRELSRFLAAYWDEPAVTAAREQIARDAGAASCAEFCARIPALTPAEALRREVERLMDADAKTTGLKQLQGLIWRGGYQSGELKSRVFPDVPPALAAWHAASTSASTPPAAPRPSASFSRTPRPARSRLLRGYYDTLTGPKREPASYRAIAADMQLSPQEVLFLSDLPAELDAARAAGLVTGLVLRPGNTRVADTGHPMITDFGQIVISGVTR